MSNKLTNNKLTNNKPVHGYKVFNPDWTCTPFRTSKQYSCPGKFEEEGNLEICGHGMHFCQIAADCFDYYHFDSANKVAEVIAYGEVITDGNKSCTNKLEIVRELSWEEVLRLVNLGKNCTGYCNTGDGNSGNYNTGNYNIGHNNTGDGNTGYRNTGNINDGNYNTGSSNSGHYNVGHRNTGNANTGSLNTGNANTGYFNTGNCNTGDWNISSYNTGCFNTEEQKIVLFNKLSNMTYNEWLNSKAKYLLDQIYNKTAELICEKDMTDEEKALHPNYVITGDYLKIIDKFEAAQLWWNELSDKDKNIIKAIPNFDADIFYECTGIRVE